MSKTPSLTPKGSHQIYFNKEKKLRIVAPMHNKDLPTGTLHAILKQAGIDKNELL
jgi:predicted RNA binding protein YcfA (HicA-like mRNA interferase family)